MICPVSARQAGVEYHGPEVRLTAPPAQDAQGPSAVEARDAPARHLAYLTDRVAMNEGRPQRFGTQVAAMQDGAAVPWVNRGS